MPMVGYLNGEYTADGLAQVPIDERGHQFGDGVYEVIRVYSGRLFLLDEHLQRLQRSLSAIGIENPHSLDEWREIVNEGVRRSMEPEAQVYLQVTRGVAVRAHLFPSTSPSVSMTVRPVRAPDVSPGALMCLPDERWANAYVKTINLLPNVIAKEAAHRANAIDALLVRNGMMREGSSTNMWFVRQGKIYTAPANRYILNGITRQFVLKLASQQGLTVCEQALSFNELSDIDEVFLTSTTQEIRPVERVFADETQMASLTHLPDDAPSSLLYRCDKPVELWNRTAPGPVTTLLQKAYSQAVENFRSYQEPLGTDNSLSVQDQNSKA